MVPRSGNVPQNKPDQSSLLLRRFRRKPIEPYMKVTFVLILILCSFATLAKDTCYTFEVQGTVKAQKDHFELIIAPETQSEVKLQIPISIQDKVFSYVNYSVTAEIVLKDKDLDYKSSLTGFNSIKRSVPDPLNAGGHNVKKLKGKVPCP